MVGMQYTDKLIGSMQHGDHKDDAAGPVTRHRQVILLSKGDPALDNGYTQQMLRHLERSLHFTLVLILNIETEQGPLGGGEECLCRR
ncbi:hypothetical protein K1T71_005655 [Dendrolimus kikuchii]|uniref:Uncharacterized protein n=1 Tax=Dendrolimus kikuchii TaxID=765133 RepID=A0ACC1D509_9NEOP|nr:hypothetical protein K1T71_005655 [Dendrolimus kikuchii]